jgi:nucleotide-binding universal stress UspA family protein
MAVGLERRTAMSILATVDGESGSDPVVQHGADLADAFDEELVVLNVQPETASVEDAEAVARDAIDGTLGEDADAVAAGALGDPAPRIISEAEDRDARYVVLGPREQTPIGKALMGSVSQLVLLNADRPVVIAE